MFVRDLRSDCLLVNMYEQRSIVYHNCIDNVSSNRAATHVQRARHFGNPTIRYFVDISCVTESLDSCAKRLHGGSDERLQLWGPSRRLALRVRRCSKGSLSS
jgi:hypothetical protein